jgi:hypothetical protein
VTEAGSGVSVAIIDSGANVPHPHLPAVAGGVAFDPQGTRSNDWVDRLGHGTAVTAAIHEKAPGAELWVVKVFDQRLATSVPALIRAIDWAAERSIRLINLSLGTPNDARVQDLQEAIARAAERGTLIVSARRHQETVWYPGALDGVVAVESDPACPRDRVHSVLSPAGSGFVRASPFPRPIPGIPPERNLHGISFAVANVTGSLAAALAGPDWVADAREAIAALEVGR